MPYVFNTTFFKTPFQLPYLYIVFLMTNWTADKITIKNKVSATTLSKGYGWINTLLAILRTVLRGPSIKRAFVPLNRWIEYFSFKII